MCLRFHLSRCRCGMRIIEAKRDVDHMGVTSMKSQKQLQIELYRVLGRFYRAKVEARLLMHSGYRSCLCTAT